MRRLCLPLLPPYLGRKGNGDEERGAGLLGIFPCPVLLAEEGRPKTPDPKPCPLAGSISMVPVWVGND